MFTANTFFRKGKLFIRLGHNHDGSVAIVTESEVIDLGDPDMTLSIGLALIKHSLVWEILENGLEGAASGGNAEEAIRNYARNVEDDLMSDPSFQDDVAEAIQHYESRETPSESRSASGSEGSSEESSESSEELDSEESNYDLPIDQLALEPGIEPDDE